MSPPGVLLAALLAVAQPQRECVQFGAERLSAGAAYTFLLRGGLEFRLAVVDGGWSIEVGPDQDRAADYLAPVSPPFRVAPHRMIGTAYGVPAEESVRVTPRQFRFVLNARDAQRARDIASAALVGDLYRLKELDKLATGTVSLRILEADADGEVVRWVGFSAEACYPESGPVAR
jgi:hypothetical protein